jgi:hypothetical protein
VVARARATAQQVVRFDRAKWNLRVSIAACYRNSGGLPHNIPVSRLATVLALVFASEFALAAQGIAPEIKIEARVIGIRRADLNRIYTGPFAKPIDAKIVAALASDPAANIAHRVELSVMPGRGTQFHLDSRVPSQEAGHFEVRIGLELMAEIASGRQILMTTTPRLKMQRINGTSVIPLFETAGKAETVMLAEGSTILVGEFLPTSRAARIPPLAIAQDNPVLRYLYSTKLQPKDRGEDEYELVVLLTPRITGHIDDGFSSMKTTTSKSSPGRYTIQVGAFKDPANADRRLADVKGRFDEAFIDKTAAKSPFYRVRVGQFADRRAAQPLLAELSAHGFGAFLTALDD